MYLIVRVSFSFDIFVHARADWVSELFSSYNLSLKMAITYWGNQTLQQDIFVATMAKECVYTKLVYTR